MPGDRPEKRRSMVLAVEIGNSHISIGGFNGDECVFVAPIATDMRRTGVQTAMELKGLFDLFGVSAAQCSHAIVGSVVPTVTNAVMQGLALLGIKQRMLLSSGVKTGVNIKTEQPRQLGSDLAANAAWALGHMPLPCVVVDLGTATTFTVLDETGALVGTAICAGVQISLEALKDKTAQLSDVILQAPKHGVLGRNTAEAIRVGSIYGTAALVEGMIDRYAHALGEKPNVVLTGGAADTIAPYITGKIALEPHVTLKGLYSIWQKNQQA